MHAYVTASKGKTWMLFCRKILSQVKSLSRQRTILRLRSPVRQFVRWRM